MPVYAALGVAVWFATHESGVHATIAGVALAADARPPADARGRRRPRVGEVSEYCC